MMKAADFSVYIFLSILIMTFRHQLAANVNFSLCWNPAEIHKGGRGSYKRWRGFSHQKQSTDKLKDKCNVTVESCECWLTHRWYISVDMDALSWLATLCCDASVSKAAVHQMTSAQNSAANWTRSRIAQGRRSQDSQRTLWENQVSQRHTTTNWILITNLNGSSASHMPRLYSRDLCCTRGWPNAAAHPLSWLVTCLLTLRGFAPAHP